MRAVGISTINHTFRIESQLGSGGSGTVFKAWHKRLRKHVVVKETKHSSYSDVEARRNEVEALKNVKSPYLPQVFDFLTKGDRSFTVLEFIEGESLDKLLERGQKFTESQVIKWYSQLASALESIHEQHICHRDIKPANLMLTPSGDVCLIDFNAALVRGTDTRLISRSAGYASPEQHDYFQWLKSFTSAPISKNSNEPDTDYDSIETQLLEEDNKTELVESNNSYLCFPSNSQLITPVAPTPQSIDWKRSDIFSLGATMYHLFTGKRPPEREREFVSMLKDGNLSKSVIYVIERSMRKKPNERFASATHLTEAINNIHKYNSRRKAQQKKTVAIITLVVLAIILIRSAER